jgi:GntR family transcriptional regulator/MocR family aminotransferase
VDVRHSEVSTQAVMAEFMAAGHFQRHIRRMRRAALSRRNCLLAHWPGNIAGVGSLPAVAAGLHLTVPVASVARERELIAQAEQVGVEVNGLSSDWLPDSPRPAQQCRSRKLKRLWHACAVSGVSDRVGVFILLRGQHVADGETDPVPLE